MLKQASISQMKGNMLNLDAGVNGELANDEK